MDWNTLISVALGGLIATIGSILNNRFQAQQRQKDRDEARKEAKIQIREKWIERDIMKIMDSVERLLILFADTRNLNRRTDSFGELRKTLLITEDEAKIELKAIYKKADSLVAEINQTMDTMSRLVYSFDEAEITSNYIDLVEETTKSLKAKAEEDFIPMRQKAGKLQKALRDKLISIRDN